MIQLLQVVKHMSDPGNQNNIVFTRIIWFAHCLALVEKKSDLASGGTDVPCKPFRKGVCLSSFSELTDALFVIFQT